MSSSRSSYGLIIGKTLLLMLQKLEARLQVAGVELSIDEHVLLQVVVAGYQTILQEVAAYLRKDKSAVLRTVDALEARQLLQRSADATDRRRKILVVTKAGWQLLQRAATVEQQLLEEVQQGLSPADVEAFERVALHMQQQLQ